MSLLLRLPIRVNRPISLRAGLAADAPALGGILWRARRQSDWRPRLFTRRDCTAFCAEMIARDWVVVAQGQGRALGFIARDGAEICALYVARTARRRGIGGQLLLDAKGQCDALWLHCRQDNDSARKFYENQGFIGVGRAVESGSGVPDSLKFLWNRERLK